MSHLSDQQIRELIQSELRKQLKEDEERRLMWGTLDRQAMEDMKLIHSLAESLHRQKLAYLDHSWVSERVDELITKNGLAVEPNSLEYRKLCLGMFEASIKREQVIQKRLNGDYSDTSLTFDSPEVLKEIPQDNREILRESISPPLGEIVAAYCAESSRTGSWTSKTEQGNKAILQAMLELIGEKTPINSVTRTTMRDYKEVITKLPPNVKKSPQYRGMGLRAVAQMPTVQPMSIKSVNKYLEKASAFFGWAMRNGYIDLNPAEGLKLKEGKSARESREAFTPDDLKALFQSKEYKEGKHKHNYQYWIPLLGLYTGARLNELCQLYVDDVQKVDDVWCLRVTDEREDQKLKNSASKRLIPLHPYLIDLGFLAYIDGLREMGNQRVFPELKKRRDGYGQAVSRWFNDQYRKKCGIADKPFHSFRHTVINHLYGHRTVKLEHAKDLVGHGHSGVTAGTYAKGTPIPVLLEAVRQLDFSEAVALVKPWTE